ncbi:hypothetical protein SAMN04488503_1048 [Humidesulfovibrio mexicanus]|uniref:Uncharacterized protein n=1 Tax=Humidesulfovibrio mexicanus TaxID=147047 RepID=A0A238YXR3_9BACT|nr:hypothetical protein [Humidesulfovibrio mexicanus]SNR75434.1 hypothetical protein SAMN04488503_1048 [Humidesulfovibrio mexicanus]
MPSNSEYAHRQFRAEATERAEKELMEQELRTLRKKVEALEEKVAFLSNQVSSRRMVEEYPRGFS